MQGKDIRIIKSILKNTLIRTIKKEVLPLIPKPKEKITFALRRVFKPLYYKKILEIKPTENIQIARLFEIKNYNLVSFVAYFKKFKFTFKETSKTFKIILHYASFPKEVKKYLQLRGPITPEIAQMYLKHQPLTFESYEIKGSKIIFKLRDKIEYIRTIKTKDGTITPKVYTLNQVSFRKKISFDFNPSVFQRKLFDNIKKEVKQKIVKRVIIDKARTLKTYQKAINKAFNQYLTKSKVLNLLLKNLKR